MSRKSVIRFRFRRGDHDGGETELVAAGLLEEPRGLVTVDFVLVLPLAPVAVKAVAEGHLLGLVELLQAVVDNDVRLQIQRLFCCCS